MFFRFASAIVLVVVVSLAGVLLEQHNRTLRRQLTQQRFQLQRLHNEVAKLRLIVERAAAPGRTLLQLDSQPSRLTWPRPAPLDRPSAAPQ